MIERADPARRRLLVALAAIGAVCLSGIARSYAGTGQAHCTALRLVGLLRHRASAAAVGGAYLETALGEANIEVLVERICAEDRRDFASHGEMSDAQLRAMIARRQQQDFDRQDVVNVDGWILSATEARLCALAALI